MRQADIERGRTYINWPETATRTVTSIRGGIIYFSEVRHDWRPPRDRCRFERFAGWAKREVEAPLPERRVRPLPECGPGTVSATYSAISISPYSSPAVRTSRRALVIAGQSASPASTTGKTVP